MYLVEHGRQIGHCSSCPKPNYMCREVACRTFASRDGEQRGAYTCLLICYYVPSYLVFSYDIEK